MPYNQLGPLVISGGNPELKPETSDSLTLGAVFRPKFLPGFDATVDYWNIDIRNVISSFSSSDVFRLCTDLPTIDNVFCQSTERDPVTHLATVQRTFLVNAQQTNRRGIDVGLRYRQPVGQGTLGVSFKGAYILKIITRTTPGIEAGDVILAGAWQNPRFRGTLMVNYGTDRFDVALNTRFISATRYAVCRTVTDESYPDDLDKIAAAVYNDISFGMKVNDKFKITFGIQNVLDRKPKEIQAVQYGSGYYDTVGRYFFGNLRITL
ncbi:MAG: TonB-dependent receptor [Sphingomonadales bacterium]|nr:TonB-dependent receptor [Sphingomonadales bacterium]